MENIFSFPNFYGLVAKKEGETVGAILGHIQTFNDVKTYYIDELFIDPSYQKQGIAKKLYQKTIKDLRREGVTGSFFTTLRNSAAYDFYVSQGAIDLKDSAVFYHPF
ncbi:GNAT family N-acetyltransferase [uncultured Peptoniphilus sp.]|uniref:GNAT family N-acetyltransferase n=1 Tax=uncultured Peptoniphilus sp. TaxID=254354 RepID=UPI00345C2CC4